MREKERVIKTRVTGEQLDSFKTNIRRKQKRALSKKIRAEFKKDIKND